jgi:hypothetical protein
MDERGVHCLSRGGRRSGFLVSERFFQEVVAIGRLQQRVKCLAPAHEFQGHFDTGGTAIPDTAEKLR